MKLAICSEVWRDVPVETVFAKAKRIGFDGVELAPFTLADDVREISPSRRREMARAAADSGVAIVGLHWLFVSPKGLHLTTPDPAVRARTVEYLKALADFCGDLSGKVMILGSPKQRSVESPNTQEDAWKRARDGLATCGPTCEARGVTLCIEALGPAETNFINTAEQAARLAAETGSPNVGIMLDYKAISTMPDGPIGTIRRFGAQARHFHTNEPDGFGPGMKADGTDFAPVLRELFATGFDGWVSVEPFDYRPDPDTVARAACETLRRAAG
jgi:sugar phosphate isomerase/epimerase